MTWRPCLASTSKGFRAACYLATALLATSLALAFLAGAFLQGQPGLPWRSGHDRATPFLAEADFPRPVLNRPSGASLRDPSLSPASKNAAASGRGPPVSSRELHTGDFEPRLLAGEAQTGPATLQSLSQTGGGTRTEPIPWGASAEAVTTFQRHGLGLLQALSQWALAVQGLTPKDRIQFQDWPRVPCPPESLQEVTADLSALHHFHRRGDSAVVFAHPIPKAIHQTHGGRVGGFEKGSMAEWDSMHANYEHVVWSDASARAFVSRCVPEALPLYDAAPAAILRSDMLRYLLLLVFGGIWGDADTIPLRVYHDWLDGVEGSPFMADVKLIAAVESDVEDWEAKKFVRPVQIVQWTMAAAPGHPVVRRVVQQMLRNVAGLVQGVYSLEENARDSENPSWDKGRLRRTGIWGSRGHRSGGDYNRDGPFTIGPIGPFRLPIAGAATTRNITKQDVLQATGPGAWTDGISWGLKERGRSMDDLVAIAKGKTFDDIVILPITAFSPGFGQGKSGRDREARVRHWFVGSWKHGVSDS